MRQYEIVVILSPMLNQSEDTEVWDSVKTFISSNQGTVKSEHSWGTRRLAYPIQKGQQKYLEGTYHLSRFETLNFTMLAFYFLLEGFSNLLLQ